MPQTVTHRGTVKSVNGKHISVIVEQAAACSMCAARRMCNSIDSKIKEIEVTTEDASSYEEGEEIMLVGSVKASLGAVLWAYVVPVVLVVGTLLGSLALWDSEPLAAGVAIVVLAVYYVALYLARGVFSKRFSFSIKHIKEERL